MYKVLIGSLAVAALAGCHHTAATTATTSAAMMNSSLVACPTQVAIGEVPSCGKVWKLGSGSAELTKDGTLTANVRGLVLNDASTGQYNGTPDGVDGVAAAVVCGGRVVAQTPVVPLSSTGDATINAKVSVPSDCTSPIIVLRERYEGQVKGWLAATRM